MDKSRGIYFVDQMKKATKTTLKSILKNLIYLKFVRMHHFAHKIGVSNTYLSRVIHQEKTYIYTLLEYLVECGARISISVIDKDCRIILSLSSTDVKELAKALGIVCRAEILKRRGTVADFAEDLGKNKQDIYAVLNAKNKASIDHLFDLFELLGAKVNLNYEI